MVRFPATAPVLVAFIVPDFISFRDRVLFKCKTFMLNRRNFLITNTNATTTTTATTTTNSSALVQGIPVP
jgi:hypothetical protein